MDTVLEVFVDESIHVRGDFIVVAAVCSDSDVQQEVVQALLDCGFDPARDEFKSSMKMNGNPAAQELRQRLQIILNDCKIGVAVCPTSERAKIVTHVAALLSNLDVPPGTHIATVHLDEGMRRTNAKMPADATVRLGCDSKLVAGIQLADCAAHLISTMLLEELGLISKTVAASTVYEEQEGEIALAWTLWATVRYALSGRKSIGESDEYGLPEPMLNPFGLVVSDACSDAVKAAVESKRCSWTTAHGDQAHD
ncbi:hypothetical protein PZN02_005292 [Sinorhizobium garamanticum]|uniref:DUF3800 domain-containing protein n=1 Tax=Sinorhizobium garamanticum TaxID=680247 RepID=A0ABY8DGF4_9HYPH|nr:hypothetical protein [Sinorhizobium garamanticum]WEX89954.1 hypothetical protein PZN02_005292 [Sinorhizobium garamanticum]